MAIKEILFPVDLSAASAMIVSMAKEFSTGLGARLHLLFVARAFQHYAGMGIPTPYINDFEGAIARQGEKRLKEFIEENFPDQEVEAAVVTGDPAEQILKTANERKVDMIIIGTHGRKGLEKIVFGSVAEQVVKNSVVPVLTINPYKIALH